ncbi:NUDIX domain-containing protein [Actinoalloteichus hymeniacidonis]|nr:NUDIX domain-containing protein [Actinoalloteichus hymeniacidonis]
MDDGEDFQTTARREVAEETRIIRSVLGRKVGAGIPLPLRPASHSQPEVA